MKIHPVFHISRLKPYNDPTTFHPERAPDSRPLPDIVDGQEEWEIDAIVDKRRHRRKLQYLVHWKGYEDSDNTWVNADDLPHAQEVIQDYEDRQRTGPSTG